MKQYVKNKPKVGIIPHICGIVSGCVVVGIFASLFLLSAIRKTRPAQFAAISIKEVQY